MKPDTTRPDAGQRQLSRFGLEAVDFDLPLVPGLDLAAVVLGLDAGFAAVLGLVAGLDTLFGAGLDELLVLLGGTRRKVCPA